MNKPVGILILFSLLLLFYMPALVQAQSTAENDNFFLAENGITIMCPEAEVGETGIINGITYTKRSREEITDQNAATSCTSGITDMSGLFGNSGFNEDISHWDVSSVTNMEAMFFDAFAFSQDIGSWDVSSVSNMASMFRIVMGIPVQDMCLSNPAGKKNSHLLSNTTNYGIGNWDVSSVTNMEMMFCGNAVFNEDISSWDVSSVTNMALMFHHAISFNHYIGDWDVANVTNMQGMFAMAPSFDQDISSWDLSKVTSLAFMFRSASSFNQNIGDWNVSAVENMEAMFDDAVSFNQDIDDWDVSAVENMGAMFRSAVSFNGGIGSWDVSNVTNLAGMFEGARYFDQDLNSWNVSKVTNMAFMFRNAESFNRDIGNWDVSNVTGMPFMFQSAESFNQDLTRWCVENIPSEPVEFAIESALLPENFPVWGTCPEANSIEPGDTLPAAFALEQNYPNPFNPTTTIRYDLPESSEVRLEIYNVMGQRVAVLVNAHQASGSHSVSFDASNLASGIYHYRLQSGNQVLTRKMTLLK